MYPRQRIVFSIGPKISILIPDSAYTRSNVLQGISINVVASQSNVLLTVNADAM